MDLFVVVCLFGFGLFALLLVSIFFNRDTQLSVKERNGKRTNVQMVVIINLTKNTKKAPFFHYTSNNFIKHNFVFFF